MADDENSNTSKAHRPKLAGPKAGKKKNKSDGKEKSDNAKHNKKAFTFHSVVKAAKQFRRAKDIETKKHHVPVVDRTPLEPPPIIVAVVGPPKVGKSTLINSLLKNFTRQNLSNIQGPVTLVSGKKRRITLIECGNDINSMIDVAKIADLVLLLIDASFGFEMEVFEFLNICQVHGFPKIMGVLTHLDMLKNNKSLKKTKKKLKDRFWTEVYQGAKLFYLSGLIHGSYPKVEVHNLGRFISVMKFRPLTWRTAHPYILADRMEDLTDPESIRQNPKCDRKVSLYGYVRGAHLKYNSKVHLLGCGDYPLDDVSLLRDPCPLPDKEKKRSLNEKERLVYAPMSGVGGIVYDKDAVYVDLGGSHSAKERTDVEAMKNEVVARPHNQLVSSLIDSKHTLDSKMASSHMTLFKDGISVSTEEFTDHPPHQVIQSEDGRVRRKALFEVNNDDSSDDDEDVDSDDRDKPDMPFCDGSNEESADDDDNDDDDDDEEDEEDKHVANIEHKHLKQAGLKRKIMESETDSDESDEERNNESSNRSKMDDKSQEGKDTTIKTKRNKAEISKSESSNESDEENIIQEKTKNKDKMRKTKHKHDKIKKMGTSPDKTDSSYLQLEKKAKHDKAEDSLTGNSDDSDGEIGMDLDDKRNIDDDGDDAAADDDGDDGDENDDGDDDDGDDGDDDDGDDDDDELDNDDIGYESDSENHLVENDDTDQDESLENENDGQLKWKDSLLQKASAAFYKHQQTTPNLRKLVYGNAAIETPSKEEDSSDEDGETIDGFFKVKSKQRVKDNLHQRDCSLEDESGLDLAELLESIQDCFVTGDWSNEDAEKLLSQDDQLSDEEIYGDFEDLETGEVQTHDTSMKDENHDDENGGSEDNEAKEKEEKMSRIEKKKKLKAAFNSHYDEGDEASFYEELKAQMSEQAQLNQKEFEDMDDEQRVQYEGFRPGMYVRVELKSMPCEFVTNFDARYPIILGGVLSNEDSLGYIQVRVKKHRWFKRILKTRDPLILSIGWRRFQSLAMYSMQDHNGRHRLLKYTPEHLHCTATLYGPVVPPNTGVLAVQSVAGTTSDFRISATGTVLALDKSIELVKKLKLTGTPTKVFKNTAFIKGMFNSALEVAKFEGASIKSVSGIRGQIKRALKTPEGAFRATFEDKLLISDIVFVRTWYPVSIPKFYNPVTSLLLPNEAKVAWQGMKTVGQLRKAEGIKAPVNKDSLYKPIERETRRFNPLVIPDKLKKDLPFKSKPKNMKKRTRPTMEAKRAVVMEPHEKKVHTLMQQLYTANKEKIRKRKEKMNEKRKIHKAELAKIDAKREQKKKEERKKVFRMMAQAEKRKKKT